MRLDVWLVEAGHAPSREKARRLIEEGFVTVAGVGKVKPSTPVEDDSRVEVEGALSFVSRGGDKLAGALGEFRVQVRGKRCLDVGASTGGFTDCLLQRGALHVTAVDVGHDQIMDALREDERVEVRENVHARELRIEQFQEPFDIAVMDLSFISAAKVLQPVAALLKEGGQLLILVKPQFEAGREKVGGGGIVRDRKIHRQVLAEHVNALVEAGLTDIELAPSRVKGREGNVEFWSKSRRPAPGEVAVEVVDMDRVRAVVDEAHGR